MNREANCPPAARSRAALGLTDAAAAGRFALQVCRDCGATQYPPREACRRCLSLELDWRDQSGEGELLAQTTLHHSYEAFFRERLPWRIGLVRLDSGVTVLAHLHADVSGKGMRVRVDARIDRSGSASLVALPPSEGDTNPDDRQLLELSPEK